MAEPTPLFHLVLYQPVIPQNTGSIARLCACIDVPLHLIHPLGFQTDSAAVKRAGLDYWDHVRVHEHASWEAFLEHERPESLYLFTKWADHPYHEVTYPTPSYLVFGNEVSGLPPALHERYAGNRVWIPMQTDKVRSLNLSQAAAIASYEVLRQSQFPRLATVETRVPL